ncbi:MAG: aminopeptidase P family protein [Desulfobacteraceae bacterium]|nr:aminopeptidase P family protein [Desulfobacteraceae bacterium]
MQIRDRITALRNEMNAQGLGAYIITGTDPHMSETVAAYWRSREFISGFTGSAGTVVVTADNAGLWTDSRYFIQAEKQLAGTGIELFRQGMPDVPEFQAWLAGQLEAGGNVGVGGLEVSADAYKKLKKFLSERSIKLVLTQDLISTVWTDRPPIPTDPVFAIEELYTGSSRKEKIEKVRREMKDGGIDLVLLSALDDNAWLLNLRGSDVVHTPVFLSHALVGMNDVRLFIDAAKVSGDIRRQLVDDGVTLLPYTDIDNHLSEVKETQSVAFASDKICALYHYIIPGKSRRPAKVSIPTRLKAVKNEVELAGIRNALAKDGVALTRFFYWFDSAAGDQPLTEWAVAEKIRYYRSLQEGFRGDSFHTGASFKENGAVIHYYPTATMSKRIEGRGLLLSDSGGQYLDGTTDITRVFPVGPPEPAEIRDYTLVLKGHIALATAVFPEGTSGAQLDALARKPLWDQHKNYLHGTGHGIGHFLGVHEGPHSISPLPRKEPLKPGMVITNEPGIYREGKYGIRIENIIVTVSRTESEFGKFLGFDTITLFPMERELIDPALLSPQEIQWLNDYHTTVYDRLSPHLDQDEKAFLKKKTGPI